MIVKVLIITVIFVSCFHPSWAKVIENQTNNPLDNTSTPQEPEVQYATVREINTRYTRPFRKRQANVVQYQVTLDNETFTVTLRPNKKLFTPGCLIHRYLPTNMKNIYPCSQGLDCYYIGSSDVHNESWVAANVCNGLNGVISFDNTSLFIEPVNVSRSTDVPHGKVHVVYRYQGNKQICPVEDVSQLHVVYGRQKRAEQSRYVRTRLVVDPTMFHFHRTRGNVEAYSLLALNIASKMFSDPSIGTKIYLTLSELVIFETYDNFTSELTENANGTLRTFCDWQSKHQSEADCSVLLTRLDLEDDFGGKGINGLSRPNTMCVADERCAIVEDEGPILGITLAHEIGHLLGMTHDDRSNGVGIMSSGGWTGREAFKWSHQSALELHASLTSNTLNCLQERLGGLSDENVFEFPLPGTLYTADEQCKLRINDTYVSYRGSEEEIKDPCKNIACRHGNDVPLLFSSPLMDGTDCNNTRTWCIGGQCVPIDQQHYTISPVDGSWSPWDREYSTCSRSCGGGVQIKQRYCNNPPPQFGGKGCVGISSQIKICNTEACESDYRSQQCADLAAKTYSHYLGGRFYSWIPDLGHIGDDSCALQCIDDFGHVWPGGKYKDGTECLTAKTAPFSRCVDGKCLDFGCDWRGNSGLKYDNCGVCNGTSSTCIHVSQTFSQDNSSGIYTNVTTIPAGSSGIQIQQSNKHCFLSFLVDGKRILNSNREKSYSAMFNLHGIQFRYTDKPEKIEITGTITKPVVVQVYRIYDYRIYVNVTPEISLTYYVPDPNVLQSYAWGEWSSQVCSRSCGTGIQSTIVKCTNVKGLFVEDFHCDMETKPEVTYSPCNTQPCPPSWKTSEWSDCSVPCGEGNKTRNVSCVSSSAGNDQVLPSVKCEHLPKPSYKSRCISLCEWKHGNWSECSRTCGEGYRTRRVYCFQRYGSQINTTFCDQNYRPEDIERCNFGPCYVLDGICVDRNPDCRQYYEYEPSACDGPYKDWMVTNCLGTCGVCANGSCTDESVCKSVDPSMDPCHSHKYAAWMKTHCPETCNICQDCTDCSKFDVKYCTDSKYEGYMKRHCAKSCQFCRV